MGARWMNTILNGLYVLTCRPQYMNFRQGAASCEETQKHVLTRILRENRDTIYGRKFNFHLIKDYRDYSENVPLTDYEDYREYIDKIAGGEKNVLTASKVRLFEPTGGSTGPGKWVPYTDGLKNEYGKGLAPWIYDLYTRYKGLGSGVSYWSVSPVTGFREITPGGIPVGFDNDADYFGPFRRFLLEKLFAVPEEVRYTSSMDTFRYVTLLFLLKAENLTLISVWHPSFLTLLVSRLGEWSIKLVRDLSDGTISPPGPMEMSLKKRLENKLGRNKSRALEVKKNLFSGQPAGLIHRQLWPNLKLVSCWTDSHAAIFLTGLGDLFPGVDIQGKGLIATEGFISFPFSLSGGNILSVRSHFFEFSDPDNNMVIPAWELNTGREYSVLLTTSGGLYRYRMHDRVVVTGKYQETPLLRFLGKETKISDYFGEKLNESRISVILNHLIIKYRLSPLFMMLSPEMSEDGIFRYALSLELGSEFIPQSLDILAGELETGLREDFHYNYCRELLQIHPARIFLIEPGSQPMGSYFRKCQAEGQAAGNIKPAVLDSRMGWPAEFTGKYI